MKRNIVGSSILVVASYAAFGQTAPLSFEASSLKPTASPDSPGQTIRRLEGGPGTPNPGRFTYTNVTLKLLVEMAYNLKEYQVEGPPWMDTVGFDLVATMPHGTTTEQASQMMQALLAERFKLEFHRETKPLSQFAMVVGKGGPKMKEVEAPAPPATDTPEGRATAQARANTPGIRMMMTPAGTRLQGAMTMTQLANVLTRRLARPVLDQTELTKTFDVDITWMPDNMDGARMGLPPGGTSGGDASEGSHKGGPGAPGADPALSLAQALQEKLGLKLDARRAPTAVLIVDRAEKAPVEN